MPSAGRSSSRGRTTLIVMSCLGFAAAATISGLDRIGGSTPALAGLLPPALAAQALRNQAMNAQSLGDNDRALALARKAVARTPIEPGSAAVLGAALYAKDDGPGADQAFRVAAQMGWRVPLTQFYWLDASLAVSDYRNAAVRLDALLRQEPALLSNRRLLDPLERTPEGRAAMAERLAERPDWLQPYLSNLRDTPTDILALRGQVLRDMARQGTVLGCEAVSPMIEQLIAREAYGDAQATWKAQCPGTAGTLVSDGNLAHAQLTQTSASLSWMFLGRAGLSLMLEKAKGPAQVVAAEGKLDRPRSFMRQLMLLQPGRYEVRWRATGEDGKPSSRIVAALSCNPDPRDWATGQFDRASGTMSATVTYEGSCEAGWLGFGLVPGEGIVRLGDISLRKAAPPP
ncbi:copper resistance protein CopC [Novosphingobium sp. KCTC 2891]|uniref:copper resistance protein CopC n=1 Tax=Novosphingobium sp. KCTC 2891 TaxID=2989730 RepID=UPI002222936E|nr:copper resistance protein CopC [Novosphingobium sp. KCTC 2891]MCW1383257.1 copper resistance protein CopC [Novosphingobium sp. KCTC 2891]